MATSAAAQQATAAEHQAGMVRGSHYTTQMPKLAQLKRDGKTERALVLALACVAAAEREADLRAANAPIHAAALPGLDPALLSSRSTPPAWTEHAAILYAKLGRYPEEVAIIQRWLARCDGTQQMAAGGTRLAERLPKAIARAARHS